ncbi:ras-related protein Rab-4B isoform X1 [Cricetulus griseus]|uniref:ras-related protein Rab-4B isoform X1 n=1 Tax=Cricetulus griseus TaxID=10029 RepID=UPI0015C319E8|nr:ras-related protein Rab-4B isoform X1 [Cricetulus griseus]
MMVWLPVLLGVILSVFPGPIEAESDMPKLADWKLCADEECSHPISMAVALQDYMAPDCRFLNIYRGQVVYVFSKLKGRGRLFWGGSVSLQSVRGMVMGFFFLKQCFTVRYVWLFLLLCVSFLLTSHFSSYSLCLSLPVGILDVATICSDFLFKFLVIGSAGTGKSCLLHQFIENKFKQDSNHTIGVEFGSRVVTVGGKTVKLQIWDTAGQERFRSVTRSYYRGAAGALLVYDITSRETYNSLAAWLTDARTLASPNIVVILCGNKKDLELELEVTFLEASRFAQENELMFLETSALTGENVEEAFLKCARTILNKIDSGELDPERMGSGIQYGHVSLRQLRQPRSAQAVAPQPCGC